MQRALAFVFVVTSAGCGARVEESSNPDARDTPVVAETSDFDLDTGESPFTEDTAVADTLHALDAAECAARTDACSYEPSPSGLGPAQSGLEKLARDCQAVEISCGSIIVNIGSDGCVLGYSLSKPERKKFAACVEASLSSVRFACAPPGELRGLVDSCTVK